MELGPVVEALQATLSHQLRKQAEEKLAQVRFFLQLNFSIPSGFFFVDLQNNWFRPMSCADHSQ
jgi:hypothetical protein